MFKSKKQGEPGTAAAGSAADLLRQDHRVVKKIFDEFDSSEDSAAKRRLAEKALIELTIHAKLEEELFYPAVRRAVEEGELVDEAEEEHHVAKLLIGELASMKASQSRFEAKFTVLAESVRHHIEEEEGEMLPKIEKSGFDLETLGQEMRERKMRLLEEVSLDSIRDESSGIVSGEEKSGGRRSRRVTRGAKSRRMGGRSRRKTAAAR